MSAADRLESTQAQTRHLEAELVKLDCAVSRNIMDMVAAVAVAHPRERAALRGYMPDERKQILLDAYIDLRSEAALSPLMGSLFRLSGTAVSRSKWLVSDDEGPFDLAAQAVNTARINFRNRKDSYREHNVVVGDFAGFEVVNSRTEPEPEREAPAKIDVAVERYLHPNIVTIRRRHAPPAEPTDAERFIAARRTELTRRLPDDERRALDLSVTSLGALERLDAMRVAPGLWKFGTWRVPPARRSAPMR